MKIKRHCIVVISIFILHFNGITQKQNRIEEELQKADSLIEIGMLTQATLTLNNILVNECEEVQLLKKQILITRILHENGQRVEAIKQLEYLLTLPVIHNAKSKSIIVDAYLVLAECYFGMYKMEKFKTISDTVLRLSIEHRLLPFYQARGYTNIARFYNYNTLVEKSKPYLDSAINMYKNAIEREKKKYNPLAILAATINFERNHDRLRLFKILDSSIALLNKGYAWEKYNQQYLWRAIGNSYFDEAHYADDKKRNISWYAKISLGFDKASSVLKKYYPNNQIDLAYINNLQGLQYFFCGYFQLAGNKFKASENILEKGKFSTENFSYLYLNTHLWKLRNLDSLYRGEELFRIKQDELSFWQRFTTDWEKWEDVNQLPELNYYRNVYAVNPYNNIVLLCYDLYGYKQDKKYLAIAFSAQESSKCYFLKKKMVGTKSQQISKGVTLETIQKNLLPNQAVISFSDVMSYIQNSFAVVITSDTISIIKIDLGNKFKNYQGVEYFEKFYSSFENVSAFKRINYQAYQIFFEPVQKILNKRNTDLLLLNSTYSSAVNFELMVADTLGFQSFSNLPYLRNKYHFTYEFSYQVATLRKQTTTRKASDNRNLQSFIPNYSGTQFYQLPFFAKSAKTLKDEFGFVNYTGKKSTLSEYESNAGSAKILHIAGHCFSDVVFTENLRIVMDSSKNGDERYLNAEKIIHTPLSADLTVLSLCETGLGEAHTSDSYYNMAYWFTYAGSKSCLYSHWKLDDRSTSYIIERFYLYLDKGMKKSLALDYAKNDYLAQAKTDEEKSPVYWGGLTLIGDDSSIELSQKKRQAYWYLSLLALPVAVYLYRRKRTAYK